MWNVISNNSEQYALKITEVDDSYDFFLSNLKYIWKGNFKESEIVRNIHELNPHLEATPKALLEKAIHVLMKSKNEEEIQCIQEDEIMTLKIDSKIGGFPFIFKLLLHLMPLENIYKEITLPLVIVAQEMKYREEKLFAIIKKKDTEIEDYRLGGAQISHKNLRTKVFDEKAFMENNSTLEFPSEMLENPVNIFTSSLNVLFELASKKIALNNNPSLESNSTEQMTNGDIINVSRSSPDLFEDFDEPEPKRKEEEPKKLPTLVRAERRHKIPKTKKRSEPIKKLIL